MDKYQKQVQSELLEHERENKKKLAANYREALKEIKKRLAAIMEDPGFKGDKVARAKWDRMLEAQLGAILERLGDDTVSGVSDYLDTGRLISDVSTDFIRKAWGSCLRSTRTRWSVRWKGKRKN